MLQQYLTELQKINLLEREEELDLWRACADGDQSAYRKIITAYQPLVFKIAMAFRLTDPGIDSGRYGRFIGSG